MRKTTLFTKWKRQFKSEQSLRKKAVEAFVNGKDTMAVRDSNKFKGHGSRTFHGIFVAAGRAEAAVVEKENKF